MIGVLVFPLCLLLPRVGGSEFPDFDDDGDNDWYDQQYVCEGDACTWSRTYVNFNEDQAVPNKTVTFEEYEYFDLDTAGLLADCAPSLSVGDIGSTMKSCKDVNWKYQGACMYRKKGWLNEDGKTVNESLGTDFVVIEGVSENIMKCLDWDGVDDYDYYDNYDYDYYDYMEESDEVQVRAKRDQKSDVPEFMIQKSRKKRSVDKIAINQRGQTTLGKKGKHGRKSRKKGKKSGKNGNKQSQRGKPLRKGRKLAKIVGKSVGERGKGGRKSEKNNHNTVKKANKKKKKTQNRKKNGDKKKNENEKKKEERKKKKKERKLLKQLRLDSMPSEEILNKLYCVDMAIQYGLEKCGEKIFQNLDLP